MFLQADDRDDAFRWVEAINAAQLSKAPQSSKLAESIALHTAKVNIGQVEGDCHSKSVR